MPSNDVSTPASADDDRPLRVGGLSAQYARLGQSADALFSDWDAWNWQPPEPQMITSVNISGRDCRAILAATTDDRVWTFYTREYVSTTQLSDVAKGAIDGEAAAYARDHAFELRMTEDLFFPAPITVKRLRLYHQGGTFFGFAVRSLQTTDMDMWPSVPGPQLATESTLREILAAIKALNSTVR